MNTKRKIVRYWLGKKLPEAMKRKISETKIRKGVHKKQNNGNWKNGVTELYGKQYPLRRKERIAGREKPERCEVCGRLGKICFDHNHKTGKFRGWICTKCNITLGFVDDNPELLILLADYLRRDSLT